MRTGSTHSCGYVMENQEDWVYSQHDQVIELNCKSSILTETGKHTTASASAPFVFGFHYLTWSLQSTGVHWMEQQDGLGSIH